MTEVDYYEIVRQKLEVGPLKAPKHEKIYELLKIFWDEDVIKILSHFPPATHEITLPELEEKTGMPEKEIKKILKKAVKKKTICKKSRKRYGLEPLLPGVFEVYFMARQDTQENLQKAAELFRYIFEHFDEISYSHGDPKIFRPILPLESKERLIKINESFDAKQQVLSYEQVEDIINQNEFFALIPCQCRLIGEMTGEPCKVAPKEMGCVAAGKSAQGVEFLGWGKTMTKEETIEYLKKTEKKGLVHMTSNTKGGEHLMYICNCCSCHCGVLMPTKNYKMKMISPSNFRPAFDGELCTNCKLCIKKCPMEVISSLEDNLMEINRDNCIGCGVCASNCPSGAMKLEKIAETDLPDWHKIGRKIFMKTMGDLMKS